MKSKWGEPYLSQPDCHWAAEDWGVSLHTLLWCKPEINGTLSRDETWTGLQVTQENRLWWDLTLILQRRTRIQSPGWENEYGPLESRLHTWSPLSWPTDPPYPSSSNVPTPLSSSGHMELVIKCSIQSVKQHPHQQNKSLNTRSQMHAQATNHTNS